MICSPLKDDELRDVKALAERYRHRRGAQGRWARLWLQLYENYTDAMKPRIDSFGDVLRGTRSY
jgi:hypothetical protein